MSTRKSMKLPIAITLIFILIIVYLFMNIKQSKVICENSKVFDGGFRVDEYIESNTDGKKIISMDIVKTIYVSDRYVNNTDSIEEVKNVIMNTLDYLGDKVTYEVLNDRIVINIKVHKNELVLLDNIDFIDNGGKIEVVINTNTKSSDVISLSVGDNYTDGELMKKMKNRGYSCK